MTWKARRKLSNSWKYSDPFPDLNSAFFWPQTEILWVMARPGSLSVLEELRNCDQLIVLITSRETFSRAWINFEIGVQVGLNRTPKIFVFGAILPWKDIPRPMADFPLTDTGNTERWVNDLKEIGIDLNGQTQEELATLFRQSPRDFHAGFSLFTRRSVVLARRPRCPNQPFHLEHNPSLRGLCDLRAMLSFFT